MAAPVRQLIEELSAVHRILAHEKRSRICLVRFWSGYDLSEAGANRHGLSGLQSGKSFVLYLERS